MSRIESFNNENYGNSGMNMNSSIRPNLNVVNDVPDVGLELLMNKKKRVSRDALSMSSSNNSKIISDTDSNDSSNNDFNLNIQNNNFSQQYKEREQTNNNWNNDDDSSDDDDQNWGNNNRNSNMNVNNDSNINQNYYQPPRMSEEELNNQKQNILYQLDRLEKKGIQLPRKHNMNSNLEEMSAPNNLVTAASFQT